VDGFYAPHGIPSFLSANPGRIHQRRPYPIQTVDPVAVLPAPLEWRCSAERHRKADVIESELRVAFSRKAQPVWFRIVKWVVFLSVARRLRATKWFRVWIAGAALAGLAVHLTYRWKTRGWTRPWGGWKDVEAGRR
jgi:hypothetical protein